MSNNNDSNKNDQDDVRVHVPEWLNKDFFEMVLKQHEDSEHLKIEKLEITLGTGKDDHNASIMFRAKINYSIKSAIDCVQKSISLITKTVPEEEGMKADMLHESTFFRTEILMYAEILPKINQLLEAADIKTQFYPKMIYSSMTPRQCIVFEDLIARDYTPVSKRFCTVEEVNQAICNLARMHAASYKLLAENDTEIPKLNSVYTRKAIQQFSVMQEGMTYLKQVLADEDDLKKYIPYIEKVEKGILDDIGDCFDPEELRKRSQILVLNHGDFHARNIMVQYTDNILKNVMLIDFQVCFYGSPVLDLMYGETLMLNPEMRTNQRDETFSKYIQIFQETLKKMNFVGKVPTNADFEEEWKIFRRWELFLLTNYLVYSYTVAEGQISVAELVQNAEVRKEVWRAKKMLDEIRVHLPRMVQQGYFE